MRVAELVERRRFRIGDAPELTAPGPGEVQVRVERVGLCGSDLHNFSEGSIGDIPAVYPMVLGHEPAGTVVRTGSGVTGWAPGDRAALEPAIYCYHCEYCMTGHHNVCSNVRFLSQPQDPGFFRDFVNLPAHNLLPVPEGVSLEEVTVFEPLAVVLHSMKFAAVSIGETAAVFGAGPIGLLTIFCLKAAGAGRVWSVEPVAHRRELARLMGADAALHPAEALEQISQDTGRRGVDVAIDCAARGDSINQCLRAARNAGRVVITAIPSEVRVEFEFHVMRRKELAIYNVRRSNHESHAALAMIRDFRGRLAPMLTHSLPLEKAQQAFEILESYSDGVGKMMLTLR